MVDKTVCDAVVIGAVVAVVMVFVAAEAVIYVWVDNLVVIIDATVDVWIDVLVVVRVDF